LSMSVSTSRQPSAANASAVARALPPPAPVTITTLSCSPRFVMARHGSFSAVIEQWAGRTAVVTGAASGIGFSMASAFSNRGMRVVLADVEQGALDEAVAKLPGAVGVQVDVSQAASVDALARRVAEELGPVHLVCNNAGVTVL